jgi:hypothetical protein
MSELNNKKRKPVNEPIEEYEFPFANEDELRLGQNQPAYRKKINMGPLGIEPPPISRPKINKLRPGDCLKIFNRPNDTDEIVDRRVGILNLLTLNKHDVVRFVDYFPYAGTGDVSWAIIEDNNNQYTLPLFWLNKIDDQSFCFQNNRTTVRAKKTKVATSQLVFPGPKDAVPPEKAAATYNANKIKEFIANTRPSGKIGENCIVININNIKDCVPEARFLLSGISVEPLAKISSVPLTIGAKVTILNVLNIRDLVVVRTTTYPIMICVIPLADITLSEVGKFHESFLPQKAVRDFIAQNPIIPDCIENNFIFFSDASRKLANYYVTQILGLQKLPKITIDNKYFKYDNSCFIKYILFGSEPIDKRIHINTFKCFSLPYGSILFFECLLFFFGPGREYEKVELIAQPFSTREHLTREEEFDLQSSLIKYYCATGLAIKTPRDDGDKFDNVFIQDIRTVMKRIIYNIMMIDCVKFNTYFRQYPEFIPCDCGHDVARAVLKAVNPVTKVVNPAAKAVKIGQSLSVAKRAEEETAAMIAEKGGSKRRTKKRKTKKRKSKKRIRRKSIKKNNFFEKKRMGRTKKRRKSIKKRK